MNARNDSVPPKRDDGDFEQIYVKHFAFLQAIATHKFGVPASEAETLVHEVFLSYLKRTGEIHDIHAWLLGGICHASRYYWRQNGRMIEPLDDDKALERPDPATTRILDSLPDQLAAREALKPAHALLLDLALFLGIEQEGSMRRCRRSRHRLRGIGAARPGPVHSNEGCRGLQNTLSGDAAALRAKKLGAWRQLWRRMGCGPSAASRSSRRLL